MRRAMLFWLAASLLMSANSAALTWNVKADSTGDAPTIAAGIDSATAGDTVLVWPGTYFEHNIWMKTKVKLIGKEGSDSTVIDAQGLDRVLVCRSVQSPALLRGFTIRGGAVAGDGAGMWLGLTHIPIENCVFMDNHATDGSGGGMYGEPTCDFVLAGCTFADNSAEWNGGGIATDGDGPPSITSCVFSENSANEGGAIHLQNMNVTAIADCELTGNSATTVGGGIVFSQAGPCTLLNCRLAGNSAAVSGGAMYNVGSEVTTLDCDFSSNFAGQYGGAVHCDGAVSPDFTSSLFHRNSAGVGGGAVYSAEGTLDHFGYCTFSNNGAPDGGCIYIASGLVRLDNSIIAYSNPGEAVYCIAVLCSLYCCDLYGNKTGDWYHAIAPQYGRHGNFSANPLFCDTLYADFHVQASSLCAAANNPGCGQTGRLDVGCLLATHAIITDVVDIPGDQGGWVRLYIRRSEFDSVGVAIPVVTYVVWRRVDNLALVRSVKSRLSKDRFRLDHRLGLPVIQCEESEFLVVEASGNGLMMPPGVWEVLGSFPAMLQGEYIYAAPTLGDSTDAGITYTTFAVTAHTSDPTRWYESLAKSGYSTDDLAPSPPPGLAMTSPTDLEWESVPEEDFDYFTVYGSSSPVLDSTGTLLGYSTQLAMDVTDLVYDYYHVTATDFAGNTGEASSIGNPYTGAGPKTGLPTAYALRQNRPNPFTTETSIAFDMPEPGKVRLTVFDLSGKLVKVLSQKYYPEGRHTVNWRGSDDSGDPVSPGVYFVRISTGRFAATRKMLCLK